MNENRIDTVAYMNAFAFMPYITDSIYDIKELLSYFEKDRVWHCLCRYRRQTFVI